ncbi:hypothetical protein D3C80_895590 [compost metagenome]
MSLEDELATPYTLYIYATNEKKTVLTSDDAKTNNKKGDIRYTGKFKAALLKKGAKRATVQSINLNLNFITLPSSNIFTLPTASKGQMRSDLLVISKWASSKWNTTSLFEIRNGKLTAVQLQELDSSIITNEIKTNRVKDNLRFFKPSFLQIREYDSTRDIYFYRSFSWSIDKMFTEIPTTISLDATWPVDPLQDYAWLHVLNDDAALGYLRESKIQVGKTTSSQVVEVAGQPVEISEMDGVTYYNYYNIFIGFEGSKADITQDTLVSEIQWYLPNITGYYYSPERIIYALGEPDQVLYYDDSFAYAMYYKAGPYAFGMITDDEGEFFEQVILFVPDKDFFDE